MIYKLHITYTHDRGNLGRIFGIIEYRGFCVESILLPHTKPGKGDRKELQVSLSPLVESKSIDVLKNKLECLVSVENIKLIDSRAPSKTEAEEENLLNRNSSDTVEMGKGSKQW